MDVIVNQACSMTGHAGEVFSVAFSEDGTRIASASGDRLVKVWATETGIEVSSFGGGALRAVG